MTSNANTSRIGTARIQNIGYGFKHAGVLMAAIELSLFTKVSEGAGTFEKIAKECRLTLLNAERLIVACTALDLLEEKDNRYVNAPDVEMYLVEGKPRYFGLWILMGKGDFPDWVSLDKRLSDPNPPSVLGIYEKMKPGEAEMLTYAMFNVGLGAGSKLGKQFDFSNYNLVLDLGGGSGAYCVSLCRRYPNLRAIVFDFDNVCKVTDKLITDSGLSNRIQTHSGNFTSDPFPEGPDVVMLNGNLTQYGEEDVRSILKRSFDILPSGGVMHIVAEILNDRKTGPLIPAAWSIHEALFGSKGRAPSESEIRSYMEEAGFTNVEVVEFVPEILSRATGHKY